MSAYLDEDVVQRVDDLGSTSWSGQAYRYTSRGRDPLSGVGARLFGGRWNPRDVFPTIYMAQPLATCVGEFDRLAAANHIDPLAMLKRPYELHMLAATDLQVLDLREEKSLRYVGLALDDIADDDRTACQAVGHAAWFLQMNGVVAPSATGNGLVIAVFENRLRPGQLRLERTIALDENAYSDARSSP